MRTTMVLLFLFNRVILCRYFKRHDRGWSSKKPARQSKQLLQSMLQVPLSSPQTSPVMTILVTIVVLPKVPEIQHTVIILVKNAVRTKTTIAAEMVAVEDEVAVTTDKTVDSNTIHVHGSNNSGHLTHNGDRGDNNHGQLHLVLTPHSIRFVHHQIVFPWLQELVHHMLTMLMSQLFQIMHLQTSMQWGKICPWMFLMKIGTWTLVQHHTWLHLKVLSLLILILALIKISSLAVDKKFQFVVMDKHRFPHLTHPYH